MPPMVPAGAYRAVYRQVSGPRDDAAMDDGQVGRLLRAVRHRSNLRQVDLAERC
jgi:hypothetical protein